MLSAFVFGLVWWSAVKAKVIVGHWRWASLALFVLGLMLDDLWLQIVSVSLLAAFGSSLPIWLLLLISPVPA